MVSRNTPSHLKLQNWDYLRPDEPLGKLHLPLPVVLTEAGAHDEGQWGRSHIIFPIRRRWVSIFLDEAHYLFPPPGNSCAVLRSLYLYLDLSQVLNGRRQTSEAN